MMRRLPSVTESVEAACEPGCYTNKSERKRSMKTGYPPGGPVCVCVSSDRDVLHHPRPPHHARFPPLTAGRKNGAILGVEALGGTCFRLFQVKEAGVPGYEFDVDADNPLAYVRLDHCPLVPGEVLRLLGGCRHLQENLNLLLQGARSPRRVERPRAACDTSKSGPFRDNRRRSGIH